MTKESLNHRSVNYRVISRPSTDIEWPIKYVAQVQGYWGWWWDIDWSYSQDSAEKYITRHYNKRHGKLPPQFSQKVVKEIVL